MGSWRRSKTQETLSYFRLYIFLFLYNQLKVKFSRIVVLVFSSSDER